MLNPRGQLSHHVSGTLACPTTHNYNASILKPPRSFSAYLQSCSFRFSNAVRASFRMVRSFAFSESGA